jgi:mRNA-degrading endonuclease YafQ of YafQ-DinJ toxin-antitoxin module
MILLKTPAFIKSAKSILKNDYELAIDFNRALNLLASDMFHPQLKTHKLKGPLLGSFACSVNYSIRIVFQIIKEKEPSGDIVEKILLEAVGSHKDVY